MRSRGPDRWWRQAPSPPFRTTPASVCSPHKRAAQFDAQPAAAADGSRPCARPIAAEKRYRRRSGFRCRAASGLFPCSGLDFFDQQDFFRVVGLAKLHFNDFAIVGLNVTADVGGFDGQFAMAAINQHAELNAARAAMIEQRVKRGARCAAGIEHVVAEDDTLLRHRHADFALLHQRLWTDGGKVIAIKRDIQGSNRHWHFFDLLDQLPQALRQRHAPAANPDEREMLAASELFYDLM